jgi:hypothetical protein
MEELLKELQEKLNQVKSTSANYLSDYEEGCRDARIDMLKEIILLVEKKII